MKRCVKCGEMLEDTAKFCRKCGVRCDAVGGESGMGNGYAGAQQMNYPPYAAPQNGSGYPVSVGGWIGRSLILSIIACIPIVGTIAYIVLLAVWSGDVSKEQTFRNWAKAQIVVFLIMLGIVLLIFIIMMALGIGFASII